MLCFCFHSSFSALFVLFFCAVSLFTKAVSTDMEFVNWTYSNMNKHESTCVFQALFVVFAMFKLHFARDDFVWVFLIKIYCAAKRVQPMDFCESIKRLIIVSIFKWIIFIWLFLRFWFAMNFSVSLLLL